jgi:hypothetical protein
MAGFTEMCERIKPKEVICYYNPFREMHQYVKVITIEYEGASARRLRRNRPISGQISFSEDAV